jgi:eukaryotic-like serine/threonine-protein kinase
MRILGGRYRLVQRIGVGGMSQVWRGYDDVLARPVAVKLLTGPVPDEAGRDELVRTEARAAARLAHPNVAAVYDLGIPPFLGPGQEPYIVLELVEGATLADHLARGALDWHIGVRVCAEVAAALAAAHGLGIVHRDVKPGNVMLTPSGAKVLDFGIATWTGRPDRLPDGYVVGTPAYLAPERLHGAPATPATDMYALGVLLYQCLTGRLPWPAATTAELLYAERDRVPDALPPIDGLDPEVADLCERCLHEDPEERPSSVTAALVLAEAVDAWVYVPPVDGRPAAGPGPVAADARRLDQPTERATAPEGDKPSPGPRHRSTPVRGGRHRAPS